MQKRRTVYAPRPRAHGVSRSVGEDKPYTLNTDGHLRSVFLGRSETVIVMHGELDLGEFGHLYFVDLDQTRGESGRYRFR